MNDKFSHSTSEQPLVSVPFPVYNGAAYLREALQSILDQTYTNFEIIIIDDGSKDESAAIVNRFSDTRIKFQTQVNQGLAATLNNTISLAKGKYLARQDQDDISLPQRFEKQVAFLEAHTDHGIIGTWSDIWIGNEKTDRKHEHPSENVLLQYDLLFNNPFVHSSMMIRTSVLKEVGLYSTDTARQPPEDYELWSRIARKCKVANIPEILHVYRELPQSMSRTGTNPFLEHVIIISAENIAFAAGLTDSDQRALDVAALMNGAYHRFSSKTKLREMGQLCREAADSICDSSNAPHGVLSERVHNSYLILRHHYLSAKYGKLYRLIKSCQDKKRNLRQRAGRLLR